MKFKAEANYILNGIYALIVLSLFQCNNPVNNDPPIGGISISPSFSGADSTYSLSFRQLSDDHDAASSIDMRIDWESDGVWDTEWRPTSPDSHVYGSSGIYTISVEIRDGDGSIGTITASCSASVWRERQNRMPIGRTDHVIGTIDNMIYVIGGMYYDGTFVSRIAYTEAYDSRLDTWTRMTDMPSRRSRSASAVVSGKVYVIGGTYYGTGNFVESFSPLTNSWSIDNTTSISYGSGIGAAAINNSIYIVQDDQFKIYDTTTESLVTKSQLTLSRQDHAVVTVSGNLYVIGGDIGSGYDPINTVEMYNPVQDIWTTKASMSIERNQHCAVTFGNRIYVIGGYYEKTCEVYDIEDDSWTDFTEMPFSCWRAAASVMDGHIYVFGGYLGSSFSDRIYELVP